MAHRQVLVLATATNSRAGSCISSCDPCHSSVHVFEGTFWGDKDSPNYPHGLPEAPSHDIYLLVWVFLYISAHMAVAKLLFNNGIFFKL